MKKKFILILFIFLIIPPINASSYWEMYVPQSVQDLTSYSSKKASETWKGTRDYISSWIPQSLKDRVNSWSTRKKVAVATAIIGSLAAIYNRQFIMQMINNAFHQEKINQSSPIIEPTTEGMISTSSLYDENDPIQKNQFEREKKSFIHALLTPIFGYNITQIKNNLDDKYLYSDRFYTLEGQAYAAAVKELNDKGMLEN